MKCSSSQNSPKEAPDEETEVVIDFVKGMPVGLNGKKMPGYQLLQELNKVAAANGVGRVDIVETRLVGMKSRGVYETPAGTLLHMALRDLEMFTINNDALHLKQKLAIDYSDLVYSGKWYSTARYSLEEFMKKTTEFTTGSVRLVLYREMPLWREESLPTLCMLKKSPPSVNPATSTVMRKGSSASTVFQPVSQPWYRKT